MWVQAIFLSFLHHFAYRKFRWERYLEEFLFFAKKVRPSGGIRKVYFSLLPAAKEEKAENSNKSVDQENFKTEAVAV